MQRVIATARGHDGTSVREPGEKFDMPDGAKGSWFEPVEDAPQGQQRKPGKNGKNDGDDLA